MSFVERIKPEHGDLARGSHRSEALLVRLEPVGVAAPTTEAGNPELVEIGLDAIDAERGSSWA